MFGKHFLHTVHASNIHINNQKVINPLARHGSGEKYWGALPLEIKHRVGWGIRRSILSPADWGSGSTVSSPGVCGPKMHCGIF